MKPDYQAMLDAPTHQQKEPVKMPETMDELQAIITERILAFLARLEMDGRLLPRPRQND